MVAQHSWCFMSVCAYPDEKRHAPNDGDAGGHLTVEAHTP